MKTTRIGSFDAKTHFSEILEKARQGERFIVTRRGKPVAEIGPTEHLTRRPRFGSERGRMELAPDFDESLADMADYES